MIERFHEALADFIEAECENASGTRRDRSG